MKKRVLSIVLALTVVMSSACGGTGSSSENTEAAVSVASESVAEEETTEVAEAAEEMDAAEVVDETAEEADAAEEADDAEAVEDEAEGDGPIEIDMTEIIEAEDLFPAGDLAEAEEESFEDNGEVVTQEEIAQMDKAMRAYNPPKESLMVNKAREFYYYEKLNSKYKALYDTLLLAVEDPEKATSQALALVDEKPFTDKFWDDYRIAYYAMLFDHPEMFWLYSGDTEIYARSSNQQIGGKYQVYFYLHHPVPDYKDKMTKFNSAAKEFLSHIATKDKTKKEISRQIHDRLTATVAYDHRVCDNNISDDVAHTAYGALVANSSGKAHMAVCDGYSFAYLYLCQQTGVKATIIMGDAGNSKNSLSGHAWSMVLADNKWREVDVTWDDVGTRKEGYAKYKSDPYYHYWIEACDDKEYGKKLGHYLYRVTTKTMSHYVPPKDDQYYTKDGKYIFNTFLNESYHVRDKEGTYGILMKLAPVAEN